MTVSGFMIISKEQALAVFHERYPQETLYWEEITDTLPANCNVYMRPTEGWINGSYIAPKR